MDHADDVEQAGWFHLGTYIFGAESVLVELSRYSDKVPGLLFADEVRFQEVPAGQDCDDL